MTADVSIHAPRAGGDRRTDQPCYRLMVFQSTPPARGATEHRVADGHRIDVSIHAPRAGGDVAMTADRTVHVVSIHAPRAGGDERLRKSTATVWFQSTPPARGATTAPGRCRPNDVVSIHAPARGATICEHAQRASVCSVSIHAPRAGGDAVSLSDGDADPMFQSTPPARGATRRYTADMLAD